MHYPKVYDVIVIGGGHAGTEAALAAARMGRQTLLLTHNIETLGQMSCNPAIGGIGKSHLVREIDALGGAMALAADKGGIQFRILNSRKGAAVRATRAQADRVRYKAAIRDTLENQANLDIFQQAADDLIVEGRDDRIAIQFQPLPGVQIRAAHSHHPVQRRDACVLRSRQVPFGRCNGRLGSRYWQSATHVSMSAHHRVVELHTVGQDLFRETQCRIEGVLGHVIDVDQHT